MRRLLSLATIILIVFLLAYSGILSVLFSGIKQLFPVAKKSLEVGYEKITEIASELSTDNVENAEASEIDEPTIKTVE